MFAFLGIRNESAGSVHGLHTQRFTVDEAQLPVCSSGSHLDVYMQKSCACVHVIHQLPETQRFGTPRLRYVHAGGGSPACCDGAAAAGALFWRQLGSWWRSWGAVAVIITVMSVNQNNDDSVLHVVYCYCWLLVEAQHALFRPTGFVTQGVAICFRCRFPASKTSKPIVCNLMQ